MDLIHYKIQQFKTKVSNNLTYSSKDFYSDFGFKNNFNLHFKNFNAIARMMIFINQIFNLINEYI